MVQQLAYSLAHVNEYFNRIRLSIKIVIQVAVGTNYFFEIATCDCYCLVAKRIQPHLECHLLVSLQNATKPYDYNVNMLHTGLECMSAIIGELMQSLYHTILCIIKTMNLEIESLEINC
jgi:methylmalonyl-CoA mutase